VKAIVPKKYGSLNCLVREGASNGPCVVFLHGYGADSSDLVPLSDMMNLSKDVTWVFPEAPLQVIIAPGFTGRAWFQIDTHRLEQAMIAGEPADLSQSTPKGLDSARALVAQMYDELLKQHSKIVVGGFSQGAMLATELTLTQSKKPTGLVIMSGAPISIDRWQTLAASCPGLPFVQSHGKNDALLGYDFAENLFQILTDAGLDGEFLSFNGGHEIPPKVIEQISNHLRALVR
jgi:phospholipase/carboxylesterase